MYWVYENWTHKRARVHKANCPYCNEGKGIHGKSSGKNDEWYGPYDNRDAAFDRAKMTRQQDVKGCGYCAP